MIMRAKAPQLHIPWVLGSAPEDIPVVPTTSGSMLVQYISIYIITLEGFSRQAINFSQNVSLSNINW
jgi:hypothetical protein